MLKDLLLFALLPACCGALAVAATLALPGGADTAAASPRALFSASLINGIAAFTLPGVIQVWFTMGETRRANQERERANREQERATAERELAVAEQGRAVAERELAVAERELAVAERERSAQLEAELADTRSQVVDLTAVVADLNDLVADLRRRLDERPPVNGATPD